MTSASDHWSEDNRRCLLAAVGGVRARLEDLTGGIGPRTASPEPLPTLDPPARFERLRSGFSLSAFELDAVLLAAGVELDGRLADVVAAAAGGARPTLGLAMAALPDAHWRALGPAAPLRRWQLVELGQAELFTLTPYRLSERTLHFLLGVDYLDPGLGARFEHVTLPDALPESYRRCAERVGARWESGDWLLGVDGEDAGAVRAVVAAGCAAAGLVLHAVDASAVPAGPDERDAAARLWEREALFCQSALLVIDDTAGDPATTAAARGFIRSLRCPVVAPPRLLAGSDGRAAARVLVDPLSPAERRALWRHALGPAAAAVNGEVEQLVEQFPLGLDELAGAAAEVTRSIGDPEAIPQRLWDACRVQSRAPMGRLAQRIESTTSWEQLVLPPDQTAVLHQIADHVRHRCRVHEAWGFGSRFSRGLGVSALFAGPSGTGKTLAAEVLATELSLDLYRIDLSQLVSKYVGETEKNLAAVFEAAERSGAILLFDEADALFGKRSAVKDSHDRYANIEVSYLLQRMESYRGLAILTTNQQSALDQAFLRRLRFVVGFPFPDLAQREAIWARIFPPGTPTADLEVGRLARLSVTGGNIRNIALHAAFLAAAQDHPVGMADVLHAARGECTKIEKPLTASEIGGWV